MPSSKLPSKAPTAVAMALGIAIAVRSRRLLKFAPVGRRMPPLPEPLAAKTFDARSETFDELPGPESFAFFEDGLYTGLADGRVVAFYETNRTARTLFRTCGDCALTTAECAAGASPWDAAGTEAACGRPLGVALWREHSLLVADAYFGLLRYGLLDGSLTTLAGGFGLLNDLAVSPKDDRYAYVSETSTKWQRRRIFYAALEMRAAGRVWRIDLLDGGKAVVADGLFMPNGLEFVDDTTLLVVSGVSVLRLDTATSKLTTPLIPVLPGTGDNVVLAAETPAGDRFGPCLWLGLGSRYAKPFNLLHAVSRWPNLRAFLVGLLPYRAFVQLIPKTGLLAVYDLHGNLLDAYEDPGGNTLGASWFSEVHAHNGFLYVGSWYNPFLLRINQADLASSS